jgi:hypothetical protein
LTASRGELLYKYSFLAKPSKPKNYFGARRALRMKKDQIVELFFLTGTIKLPLSEATGIPAIILLVVVYVLSVLKLSKTLKAVINLFRKDGR